MPKKITKAKLEWELWKDNHEPMTDDDLTDLFDAFAAFCERQGWSWAGVSKLEPDEIEGRSWTHRSVD